METHDFIVVGSGPSGAALSSRLSTLLPSHTILLLEAGSSPIPTSDSLLFDRYSAFRAGDGTNWGYETVGQEALDGRVIDYSRGKGLGGTSLINFALWNRGGRDDWNRIAELTSSPQFAWKHVKGVFDRIENFNRPDAGLQKYVDVKHGEHGDEGPVNVDFARELEKHMPVLLRGVEEFGWKVNKDINSGDPIGVGLCPATATGGVRVTARSAYLKVARENLTIKTGWQVARVLIENEKAVGVESVDGEGVYARREVLLSAGSLDSPKLLLLSGIGPRTDLEKLNIPVIRDLPGVGKNLQDHCHFPITAVLKDGIREPNTLRPGFETLATARSQFDQNGTGPLSYVNGSYIMGFLKDAALYESEEYKNLDINTREHLMKDTVPTWELSTGLPLLAPPPPGPPRQYMVSIGVLMNPQSRGTVSLKNTDPRDDALFDPRLMTHPYDRKVLTTAEKRILEYMSTPSVAETIEKPASMPASESEDDICNFVKSNLKSTWHMSGTCKMGDEGDELAVVDNEFRVRGVKGLRVVDLSVLPVLVNAHPVGAAYMIGEIAASAIGEEYGSLELWRSGEGLNHPTLGG